jgi:hypothetical protein
MASLQTADAIGNTYYLGGPKVYTFHELYLVLPHRFTPNTSSLLRLCFLLLLRISRKILISADARFRQLCKAAAKREKQRKLFPLWIPKAAIKYALHLSPQCFFFYFLSLPYESQIYAAAPHLLHQAV